MLSTEKAHSMSRKEYLKKKKKSKMKFPLLKPILICIVMVALFIYVIHQLHVYNTVTEMANKVVEESKLIKTYKMFFMSKPYEKEQTDNILYMYTGADESRVEVSAGLGLSQIQIAGDFLYGIKDGNLLKVDTIKNVAENVCDGDVQAYAISQNVIYVYRYNKNDSKKTGIYKLGKNEELILNIAINQLLVDGEYIYVVSKDNTARTLIRYSLDGKVKKVLTNKILVNNIIQDENYIYYINGTDKNKLYKVRKDGEDSNIVTENSCVEDTTKYNGNHLFEIYNGNVIYINAQDNKVYITTEQEEKILVDNKIKYLQLNSKILYLALKDKIDIYRLNIESNELDKITSARFTEFIFTNN